MQMTILRAAAMASALSVVSVPVLAGDTGMSGFTPPAGWGLSEQTETSMVYKRGPCGFAIGTLKSVAGSFDAAAEDYLETAIKRNVDRGEVVEKLGAATKLGNTGIITRSFVAHVNGTPTWNIRAVGPQGGALRPFYLRCTEAEAFKESWPVVGQAMVEYLGGTTGARESGAASKTPAASAARLLLGTWYGANVMGQIDVHPDGTYSSPNGARGTWQATGERSLTFTSGPLTAWNGGRAIISDKNALEFKWTTPQGHKQYFVYIRR